MRYALLVTLREELGTVARLLLLLNQRGLHPEALSVARGPNGRLTAVVQISGDTAKADWAARQLRRMRSVEEARVLGEADVRQWVRLSVPRDFTPPVAPEGLLWHVVGEDGGRLVVEASGTVERLASLMLAPGVEVLLSLLQPPPHGGQPSAPPAAEPTSGRSVAANGRKVVVRPGRRSHLA
jgi:hypothetical protein